MTVRAVAAYDSDSPVPEKATRWVYLWGILQRPDIRTPEHCKSVCAFESKTNLGYLLVSVISPGTVVPLQVEYSCCPPDPPAANLE